MKFLVQVICVSEHVERRQQVFEMEREHLTMETLGLGLGESKALLRGVQEFVVVEQVAADLGVWGATEQKTGLSCQQPGAARS